MVLRSTGMNSSLKAVMAIQNECRLPATEFELAFYLIYKRITRRFKY